MKETKIPAMQEDKAGDVTRCLPGACKVLGSTSTKEKKKEETKEEKAV